PELCPLTTERRGLRGPGLRWRSGGGTEIIMLALYGRDDGVVSRDLAESALSPDAVWIDLLDPVQEEIAFVERVTQLTLPSLEDLSEIQTSSRLYIENGALFLSAPLLHRRPAERPERAPVGFVLTRDRLITVRFKPLVAFETYIQTMAHA